ncbi:hypothetical protein Tco_0440965, partial [Tanacetum coccineum]
MDELYYGKVPIPIQWDHREARSKENPGSEAQPSAITRSAEERIKMAIHPVYPEQTIATGSTLTEEGLKELCGLLRRNLDIFSWKPEDMTRVSWHIAE